MIWGRKEYFYLFLEREGIPSAQREPQHSSYPQKHVLWEEIFPSVWLAFLLSFIQSSESLQMHVIRSWSFSAAHSGVMWYWLTPWETSPDLNLDFPNETLIFRGCCLFADSAEVSEQNFSIRGSLSSNAAFSSKHSYCLFGKSSILNFTGETSSSCLIPCSILPYQFMRKECSCFWHFLKWKPSHTYTGWRGFPPWCHLPKSMTLGWNKIVLITMRLQKPLGFH